jgi:hypothetical protein
MQASAAMRSMLGMQNVLNGVSMAGLRYNVGSMIRFTLNGNNSRIRKAIHRASELSRKEPADE